MSASNDVMAQLGAAATAKSRLRKAQFTLSNGTANERTQVASFEAETPLVLREQADIRLMLTTVEEFQTSGTGSSETFNLSNNIIESPNTANLVLFSDGNRVQPGSVDYSNDSFDYTDGGSQERLHAHYVARDPVQVQIEKEAPRAQGNVTEVVWDGATSLFHERDQNQEPLSFDFDRPAAKAVPRKWDINIYADGPYPIEWNDEAEANSQSTVATNAIISLPVKVASTNVPDLSDAVKRHIIR